jgi:protein TonB
LLVAMPIRQPSSARIGTPFAGRAIGIGGTAVANLLLLLMLLGFRVDIAPRQRPAALALFDVQVRPPEQTPPPRPQPRPKVQAVAQRVHSPEPLFQTPSLPHPMPTAPEVPAPAEQTKAQAPAKSEAAAPPAALPVRPAASPPVLAARAWVRKPSSSQLDRYRPTGSPAGWGVVSCRTAPGRRVTDCVEVESFPASSRLASAVKRAAWQFRIMPPRRNGEDLIGEWVQIRVDYVAPKR